MLEPREAKADSYIYKIAIFSLVILVAIAFSEHTRRNATQYTYLEFYSSETEAVILKVCESGENCQTPDPFFGSEYVFQYVGANGQKKQKTLILARRSDYHHRFSEGTKVDVIVEEDWDLLVPIEIHKKRIVDRNIFISGCLTILFFLILILFQLAAYRKFKEASKFY